MKSNTEENFSVVPQLWGRAAEEGWIGKLAAMMNAQPMGILGVSACFENENWKYFISVASDLPAEAPLEEVHRAGVHMGDLLRRRGLSAGDSGSGTKNCHGMAADLRV